MSQDPPEGLAITRRFRFSMATILMLVVTAAAGSALFAKLRQLFGEPGAAPIWTVDIPSLVTLAIALTAVALGALKGHSAVQIMLQATLAYLGYLSVLWLVEAEWHRLLLYWFQATFALTVALPLVARRIVKNELPRGPRRRLWMRTLEAVVFSFLNMGLVLAGLVIEYYPIILALN